jgi:carbon-monoxide dehydrogenase medium subunit
VQVPAPFEYERATSVEHAVSLLERLGPEARIVAGGHSLLPMMKLRLATPEYLIDINDLTDLDYIREDAEQVRIGALTRHRELEHSELLDRRFPIFAEAERLVADPLVRNRGTIGGSLCQGDPAEDLAAVCSAVKASAVIRGSAGERVVPVSEFHVGPYETVVGDAEMLVELRIPVRSGAGSAQEKVKRRAGDWAIASSAVALWLDDRTIADAGVALGALGPTTVHASDAEEALRGRPASEEAFAEAAGLAAEACSPAEDQRGPVDYKLHLARELTIRALRRAAARALHQEV